ncbi:MAG: rod shape-determining protein MreC [Myxococcales bacterium]
MRDTLRRYRAIALTFLVLTLPLFSLYFHGKRRPGNSPIETGLLVLTSPVQAVAHEVLRAVEGVWSDYVWLVGLAEENQRLLREHEVLLGEALRAKTLLLENERLKKLLEFKKARTDVRTIAARVIGRDISPNYRVLKVALDTGASDHVTEGMPVITHEGVVGRISNTGAGWSDVMLAVDARSQINVTIAGKGVTGVLTGRGDRNEYGGKFSFLHKSQPVEKDDTVVTSGHDKVFPPGLEVGYIASDSEHQDGLYYVYDVTPAVNFSTLEEVLIVVDRSPDPTADRPQEKR